MFFGKSSLRRKSLALNAFAAAILASSLTAFAAPATQADRRNNQEVYLNMGDEPPSMDPNKGVDSVSYFWLGHLFEGLMTTDKNGNVVPGTASHVAVSDNGKTYTFTIHPNAKWHDGKKVGARGAPYAEYSLTPGLLHAGAGCGRIQAQSLDTELCSTGLRLSPE